MIKLITGILNVIGKTREEIIMRNLLKQFDTTDVALRISEASGFFARKINVSKAYVGVEIRTPDTYILDLRVSKCASDAVTVRTGRVWFENVHIEDLVPYTYTKINHKDLMQFYNFNSLTNELVDKPVENIGVSRFYAKVSGDDKHIFHFTETCGYNNVRLFALGCDIETVGTQNNQYLISSTNAVDWVIGSKQHPLDPLRIGNRIIRIDGRKKGSKPSSNITIHAYRGLRLELDESARAALNLIEYER